jgi:hypothetical protein
MFSMAAAGLVRPLIAVTVALNPAAAHHGPGSYTVRPGDTSCKSTLLRSVRLV